MLEYVNRENSNCYKWDSQEAKGTLPLWVADMDFKAAPAIRRALQRRLDHGVFGYSIVPDAYYEAVNSWFCRRYGWSGISRENSIPTIGVVPAVSVVIKAFQMRPRPNGDTSPLRVMTFTPAYNCFFSCINNMGAELLDCPLTNNNGHYEIDFFKKCEDMVAAADILLLCNPHNPTGRVWTKDELLVLAGMCEAYGTTIVSDEIHGDIAMPGYKYTPLATIMGDSTDYVVFTSASKAFNIAGLQCANIFTPNKKYYQLIDRAVNIHEVCDLNPFAAVATIAAYNESEDWLRELNAQVYNNYLLLKDAIKQLPQLRLTEMEGTYLAWVDIRSLGMSSEDFCHRLAEEKHVLLNPSEMYGGEGFVRINLATSSEILAEALKRLTAFVNKAHAYA